MFIKLTSRKNPILLNFKIFQGSYFSKFNYKNNSLNLSLVMDGKGMYEHGLKFKYNQKFGKVELIGYDFNYKLSNGGHCYKTYNVLNGNYSVRNITYDLKSENKKVETHKGVEKLPNKYFIENIDENLVSKILKIGNKYEIH